MNIRPSNLPSSSSLSDDISGQDLSSLVFLGGLLTQKMTPKVSEAFQKRRGKRSINKKIGRESRKVISGGERRASLRT